MKFDPVPKNSQQLDSIEVNRREFLSGVSICLAAATLPAIGVLSACEAKTLRDSIEFVPVELLISNSAEYLDRRVSVTGFVTFLELRQTLAQSLGEQPAQQAPTNFHFVIHAKPGASREGLSVIGFVNSGSGVDADVSSGDFLYSKSRKLQPEQPVAEKVEIVGTLRPRGDSRGFYLALEESRAVSTSLGANFYNNPGLLGIRLL